ncbi:MAG: four helix bundle protein [Bacteroidetes bacterium]|nr:four helix bundle protein [Bacteroidota bacterium]
MQQEFIDKNPILNLTFNFSLAVIEYCKLLDSQKQFQLSKQLFRSGTSIGANAREAQNAESKADFIHKFKIAAKETDETQYWLLLCNRSKDFPDSTLLLKKLDEIDKVITKIISSSKLKT